MQPLNKADRKNMLKVTLACVVLIPALVLFFGLWNSPESERFIMRGLLLAFLFVGSFFVAKYLTEAKK